MSLRTSGVRAVWHSSVARGGLYSSSSGCTGHFSTSRRRAVSMQTRASSSFRFFNRMRDNAEPRSGSNETKWPSFFPSRAEDAHLPRSQGDSSACHAQLPPPSRSIGTLSTFPAGFSLNSLAASNKDPHLCRRHPDRYVGAGQQADEPRVADTRTPPSLACLETTSSVSPGLVVDFFWSRRHKQRNAGIHSAWQKQVYEHTLSKVQRLMSLSHAREELQRVHLDEGAVDPHIATPKLQETSSLSPPAVPVAPEERKSGETGDSCGLVQSGMQVEEFSADTPKKNQQGHASAEPMNAAFVTAGGDGVTGTVKGLSKTVSQTSLEQRQAEDKLGQAAEEQTVDLDVEVSEPFEGVASCAKRGRSQDFQASSDSFCGQKVMQEFMEATQTDTRKALLGQQEKEQRLSQIPKKTWDLLLAEAHTIGGSGASGWTAEEKRMLKELKRLEREEFTSRKPSDKPASQGLLIDPSVQKTEPACLRCGLQNGWLAGDYLATQKEGESAFLPSETVGADGGGARQRADGVFILPFNGGSSMKSDGRVSGEAIPGETPSRVADSSGERRQEANGKELRDISLSTDRGDQSKHVTWLRYEDLPTLDKQASRSSGAADGSQTPVEDTCDDWIRQVDEECSKIPPTALRTLSGNGGRELFSSSSSRADSFEEGNQMLPRVLVPRQREGGAAEIDGATARDSCKSSTPAASRFASAADVCQTPMRRDAEGCGTSTLGEPGKGLLASSRMWSHSLRNGDAVGGSRSWGRGAPGSSPGHAEEPDLSSSVSSSSATSCASFGGKAYNSVSHAAQGETGTGLSASPGGDCDAGGCTASQHSNAGRWKDSSSQDLAAAASERANVRAERILAEFRHLCDAAGHEVRRAHQELEKVRVIVQQVKERQNAMAAWVLKAGSASRKLHERADELSLAIDELRDDMRLFRVKMLRKGRDTEAAACRAFTETDRAALHAGRLDEKCGEAREMVQKTEAKVEAMEREWGALKAQCQRAEQRESDIERLQRSVRDLELGLSEIREAQKQQNRDKHLPRQIHEERNMGVTAAPGDFRKGVDAATSVWNLQGADEGPGTGSRETAFSCQSANQHQEDKPRGAQCPGVSGATHGQGASSRLPMMRAPTDVDTPLRRLPPLLFQRLSPASFPPLRQRAKQDGERPSDVSKLGGFPTEASLDKVTVVADKPDEAALQLRGPSCSRRPTPQRVQTREVSLRSVESDVSSPVLTCGAEQGTPKGSKTNPTQPATSAVMIGINLVSLLFCAGALWNLARLRNQENTFTCEDGFYPLSPTDDERDESLQIIGDRVSRLSTALYSCLHVVPERSRLAKELRERRRRESAQEAFKRQANQEDISKTLRADARPPQDGQLTKSDASG
ncbi:hypothetical protein BESB_000380 [Besnoitia besnoiti]|uniref:Transmembrane protein n=1 Tax=Besnoitia besnoiti TaxID=94643 RepID=A0A2A9MNB8_BESBE|nr:hypothetical protein BESB_000380 [Besnoitia besnoiti]PFH37696.1 hypothetical protein BESB_000380 [Besnoitia besnoiti]